MSLYLEDKLSPSLDPPSDEEDDDDVEEVESLFGAPRLLFWDIVFPVLLWRGFPFLRWLASNIFGSKDHELRKNSNMESG